MRQLGVLVSLGLLGACAGGAPAVENETERRAPTTLPDPDSLIGKDANAIESLMGAPALIRRDGPAEIWQYPGARCTANLFLYRASKEGALALDHIEAHGHDGKRMEAAACFADIEAAAQ